MRAYGFALQISPDSDWRSKDMRGYCVAEDGTELGHHISSNIDFLKMDLAKYAAGYEYIFYDLLPDDIFKMLEAARANFKPSTTEAKIK